jgi:hypothetical protein
MLIIKIQFSLNRLADGIVCIVVRKLAELPKFLVFNSGTNSFLEEFRFRFLLTVVRFIQIPVFAFWSFGCGVTGIFYVCVSDGAKRLPPLRPRRGREAVFHGPALPEVSEIAIRRTYPSWL